MNENYAVKFLRVFANTQMNCLKIFDERSNFWKYLMKEVIWSMKNVATNTLQYAFIRSDNVWKNDYENLQFFRKGIMIIRNEGVWHSFRFFKTPTLQRHSIGLWWISIIVISTLKTFKKNKGTINYGNIPIQLWGYKLAPSIDCSIMTIDCCFKFYD